MTETARRQNQRRLRSRFRPRCTVLEYVRTCTGVQAKEVRVPGRVCTRTVHAPRLGDTQRPDNGRTLGEASAPNQTVSLPGSGTDIRRPAARQGGENGITFAPGVPLFCSSTYGTRKAKVGAGRARRRRDGPSSSDERPDQAVAWANGVLAAEALRSAVRGGRGSSGAGLAGGYIITIRRHPDSEVPLSGALSGHSRGCRGAGTCGSIGDVSREHTLVARHGPVQLCARLLVRENSW